MIKLLDRYIIGQYIKTFLFTALIFSLIAVVIDFSDRLDAFIKNEVTVKEAIFSYYIHFIGFINGMLWPLFALISVIFFTSRLAKNSEIICILNAGVPFRRLMLPYLLGASLFFCFHLLANHFLIPLGSKIRIPFENEHVWHDANKTRTRDIHVLLDPQTKLYIRNYRQSDTTALSLRLENYNDEGQMIKFLEAKRVEWLGPPDRWKLIDYVTHYFDGINESVEVGTSKQLDTTINITPEDLVRVKNQWYQFTTPELNRYLRKQRSRGIGGTRPFETELFRRTSEPVSIFVLTIIGLAVASRKTRGGIGMHLAIGIAVGAIYIVLSRFTMTFTNSESLGPVLGVWLPNIVFALVAWYLVRVAQK